MDTVTSIGVYADASAFNPKASWRSQRNRAKELHHSAQQELRHHGSRACEASFTMVLVRAHCKVPSNPDASRRHLGKRFKQEPPWVP